METLDDIIARGEQALGQDDYDQIIRRGTQSLIIEEDLEPTLGEKLATNVNDFMGRLPEAFQEGVKAGFDGISRSIEGLDMFFNTKPGDIQERNQAFKKMADIADAKEQGYTQQDLNIAPGGFAENWSNPSWWAYELPRTFTYSLPTMAAGGIAGALIGGPVGAAYGAGAAGIAGGAALGASAGAGLQQVGNVYAEEMQQHGDSDLATERAWKSGVSTGAVNLATLGILKGVHGPMGGNLLKNVAQKAGMSQVAAQTAVGLGTEASMEAVDQVFENYIRENDLMEGTLDSFILGLAAEAPTIVGAVKMFGDSNPQVDEIIKNGGLDEYDKKQIEVIKKDTPVERQIIDKSKEVIPTIDQKIEEFELAFDDKLKKLTSPFAIEDSEQTSRFKDVYDSAEQEVKALETMYEKNKGTVSEAFIKQELDTVTERRDLAQKAYETSQFGDFTKARKEYMNQQPGRDFNLVREFLNSPSQETIRLQAEKDVLTNRLKNLTSIADTMGDNVEMQQEITNVINKIDETNVQLLESANVDFDPGRLVEPVTPKVAPEPTIPTDVMYGKAEGDGIDVSPIEDTEGSLDTATKIFRNKLGTRAWITTKKGLPKKAGGVYKPSDASVVARAGNYETLIHEAGHFLHDKHKIVPTGDERFDTELEQLWTSGNSSATENSDINYKRGEGVAEYFRKYVLNPEATKTAYPEFTKFFESQVGDDLKYVTEASDEIRKWAGMTATKQAAGQIEVEAGKTTGIGEKVRKKTEKALNIQETPPGSFEKKTGTYMQKLFTSAEAYAQDAAKFLKDVKGMENLAATKDPEIWLNAVRRMDGAVQEQLESGIIDPMTGEKLTDGGFTRIVEPISKTNLTPEEYSKKLQTYMVAERTIELGERKGKDLSKLTGIAGLYNDDVAQANKVLAEFNDNPQSIGLTPDDVNAIKESATRYRDFAKGIIQLLVNSGIISEDVAESINETNQQYVTLERVMNDELGTDDLASFVGHIKGAAVTTPVKKIKGSARKIKDTMVSLMDVATKAMESSYNNQMLRSFANLVEPSRDVNSIGDVTDTQAITSSVIRNVTEPDGTKPTNLKNVMTVKVDGENKYYQFDKDVYDALNNLSELPKLHGLITFLPKLMRNSIIYAPPFAIRNVTRDIQNRMIISETGSNPFNVKPSEIKKLEQELAQSAGGFAGYYKSRENYQAALTKSMRDLARNKDVDNYFVTKAGDMVDLYKGLIEQSEKITRASEFKSAIAKSKELHPDWSEQDHKMWAAQQSADLMDFTRSGVITNYINQLIPFTNAAVQGLSKTYRRVADSKDKPKAVAELTAKFAATILIPRVAARMINLAMNGPEAEEEYEQMPSYIKDMFISIKLPGVGWLRIPQPYEFAVAGSSVERMFDFVRGDENAFDGAAGSVANVVSPISLSNIGGPLTALIQAATNYDLFRDKRIVPVWEEDLALEKRKGTKYASRLGQTLQDLTGVDARKNDFLVKSLLAYPGVYMQALSDIGREDKTLDVGKLSGFKADIPGPYARDVNWVEDYAKKQGQTKSRYMRKLKKLKTNYYNTKDLEQREKIARTMRDYATKLRAKFGK